MKAAIEVLDGPEVGRRYELRPGTATLVGRSPRCHLFLSRDQNASRLHLIIETTELCCVARDLGSVNGFFINEVKVPEAELHHGDILIVGCTKLRFETDTIQVSQPASITATSLPEAPKNLEEESDIVSEAIPEDVPHTTLQEPESCQEQENAVDVPDPLPLDDIGIYISPPED